MMMGIFEIILKRYSVRRYKKIVPQDSDIQKILEAGRWAPSGLNNQPWRFFIIRDKKQKDGLAPFTKYGRIIKGAAVLIVVCLSHADSYDRDKDLMAIGACIQNMLLEAHSLGLGACWLGEILHQKKGAARYLRLDNYFEIMAVISLGYPDGSIGKRKRKPLTELLLQ